MLVVAAKQLKIVFYWILSQKQRNNFKIRKSRTNEESQNSTEPKLHWTAFHTKEDFCLASLFNDITTFGGYLKPNPQM